MKALKVVMHGIPLLSKYIVANNSQVQYTHWDDPNELVDHLRILAAERQAGNNGHDNQNSLNLRRIAWSRNYILEYHSKISSF